MKHWTLDELNKLASLIKEQMDIKGYVVFRSIGVDIGRGEQSCESKALYHGIPFVKRNQNKRDMYWLPRHKDGSKVNYGGAL